MPVHLDDGVEVVHDIFGAVTLDVGLGGTQLFLVGRREVVEQALVVVVLGVCVDDSRDVLLPLVLQHRLDRVERESPEDSEGRFVVI